MEAARGWIFRTWDRFYRRRPNAGPPSENATRASNHSVKRLDSTATKWRRRVAGGATPGGRPASFTLRRGAAPEPSAASERRRLQHRSGTPSGCCRSREIGRAGDFFPGYVPMPLRGSASRSCYGLVADRHSLQTFRESRRSKDGMNETPRPKSSPRRLPRFTRSDR